MTFQEQPLLSFQHIGDQFPHAICLLSYTDRRVLYVNPAFEDVWQIAAHEFIADPLRLDRMIHTEDLALRTASLERQLAGERLESEFRIVSPAGQERRVREFAFGVVDATGVPTCLCVITRDIPEHLPTLRRQADSRFQVLFDHIPESLFCTDRTGIIHVRNPSSLSKDKVLVPGDHLERIFLEDDRPTFLVALAEAAASRLVTSFDVRLGPEEGTRWVSGRISPLPGETDEPEFIISLRDITHRKRNEATLQQANSEVTATNARLRELDALKNRFVAGLAHDLRSPLSAVSGAIDIMQLIGVSDELNDYILLAREGLEHARSLIHELLEVGRVEIGGDALERTEFDPKSSILECLGAATIDANLRFITIRSSVTVDSGPLPFLFADRVKFKRVLDNLLVNAVKFTPPGGTVSLKARIRAEMSHRFLIISISDTGIGIEPEDLETIFDPYKQARPHHRHLGVGLGLALVKHIVEAHDGTVDVESEIGKGTTFTVTFPVV